MEIAPVHHPVWSAVHRARRCAEIEQLPGLPGVIQPDLLAGRLAGDRLHLPLEIKRDQNARAVGAELHAGAELAQLRRLFENLNLDSSLDERKPSHQAADSGPRNQNFRPLLMHDRSLQVSRSDRPEGIIRYLGPPCREAECRRAGPMSRSSRPAEQTVRRTRPRKRSKSPAI